MPLEPFDGFSALLLVSASVPVGFGRFAESEIQIERRVAESGALFLGSRAERRKILCSGFGELLTERKCIKVL